MRLGAQKAERGKLKKKFSHDKPQEQMEFLILLALLIAPNAYSLTKPEAVQLSKSRIQGLTPRFASLAYNCFMFDHDCQIEGGSQEATLKWLSFEFNKHVAKIEYSSGPENFLIDGAIRIAKTGKSWGTPVIFNEDLLALETQPGRFEALGFFEILGVLVHEFGHHQETLLVEYGMPPLQHYELDLIAAKVIAYLKDRTRRIQLGTAEIPGLKSDDIVSIYQIDIEWDNGIRNIWSNIFIDSIAETKEISTNILQGLRCPRETTEGHITFQGEPAYAAFRQVRAPKFEAKPGSFSLEQEIGAASVLCIDSQMNRFQVFDGYKDGHLRLVFKANPKGQYLIDTGASQFRAVPPPEVHARHY